MIFYQFIERIYIHIDELLTVIETELDKKFHDVEIITTDHAALPLDEYLKVKSESAPKKYRFLIMTGNGDTYNGLPVHPVEE